MPPRDKDILLKILNIFVGLISAVALALAGWVLNIVGTTAATVQELDKRVAIIEGNRFTSNDAIGQMTIFQREVQGLRIELSAIRELIAALPKEVPPEWFLREVRTLEARVDKIERDDS